MKATSTQDHFFKIGRGSYFINSYSNKHRNLKKLGRQKEYTPSKNDNHNDPNEIKISTLPDKEFKDMMIIRMVNDLESRIEELRDHFNKELENVINYQSKIMNTITEMKYTPRNQHQKNELVA